ncbi:MAG TPA: CoA-binding protein, partial [Beijerinckiaceae bacterium]|nr:CoA-binding protein [Beijerinckiaceae bacterium]
MPSASSINRLMRPNSIAIVGASPRARMGMAIIKNARTIGLKGSILPVNPNYREIDGLPCYPSLRELPESPDCVIVIVPAPAVLPVIAEAGAQGVRAAIVVANGFADARTDEGRERQRGLVELASTHDMAIAGPNCLGLSSIVYRFANTYTDLPEHARAGGISIISQSGGLLNAAAFYAADRCSGLNYLISGGNHAVMDIPAYIDFLADDPSTKVIACIM